MKPSQSATQGLLVPLTAIACAVLCLNLLSWAFGGAPASTLTAAIGGSWGTAYGIGQVLFKATPLLFAGIAVDLALRGGLFNVGVEGQIAVGSLVGTVVAIHMPLSIPAVGAVAICLACAGLAGGLWAGVAGMMKSRLGVHEVITTIMLNRIADALVAVVMTSALALSSTTRTADVHVNTQIPRLDTLAPALTGSAASFAFPLAVGVLLSVFVWLRRSRVGREIVWVGLNERACAVEGIPVARRKELAMILSGAIGAMAVAGTVLGYKGYFEIGLGAGAGFGGIAVAFLGRGSAWGLALAALLFGTLEQAGLAINAQVPKEAMGILEAVVIVAVALSDRVARRQTLVGGAEGLR